MPPKHARIGNRLLSTGVPQTLFCDACLKKSPGVAKSIELIRHYSSSLAAPLTTLAQWNAGPGSTLFSCT